MSWNSAIVFGSYERARRCRRAVLSQATIGVRRLLADSSSLGRQRAAGRLLAELGQLAAHRRHHRRRSWRTESSRRPWRMAWYVSALRGLAGVAAVGDLEQRVVERAIVEHRRGARRRAATHLSVARRRTCCSRTCSGRRTGRRRGRCAGTSPSARCSVPSRPRDRPQDHAVARDRDDELERLIVGVGLRRAAASVDGGALSGSVVSICDEDDARPRPRPAGTASGS